MADFLGSLKKRWAAKHAKPAELELDRVALETIVDIKARAMADPNLDISEEFFNLVKDFFQKFFKIRYQFTYEELITEMTHRRFDPKAKKEIIELAERLIKMQYSDARSDRKVIMDEISLFEDTVIRLTADGAKAGGHGLAAKTAEEEARKARLAKTEPHHAHGLLGHLGGATAAPGEPPSLPKPASQVPPEEEKYMRPEDKALRADAKPEDHLTKIYALFNKAYSLVKQKDLAEVRNINKEIRKVYARLDNEGKTQFGPEIRHLEEEIAVLQDQNSKKKHKSLPAKTVTAPNAASAPRSGGKPAPKVEPAPFPDIAADAAIPLPPAASTLSPEPAPALPAKHGFSLMSLFSRKQSAPDRAAAPPVPPPSLPELKLEGPDLPPPPAPADDEAESQAPTGKKPSKSQPLPKAKAAPAKAAPLPLPEPDEETETEAEPEPEPELKPSPKSRLASKTKPASKSKASVQPKAAPLKVKGKAVSAKALAKMPVNKHDIKKKAATPEPAVPDEAAPAPDELSALPDIDILKAPSETPLPLPSPEPAAKQPGLFARLFGGQKKSQAPSQPVIAPALPPAPIKAMAAPQAASAAPEPPVVAPEPQKAPPRSGFSLFGARKPAPQQAPAKDAVPQTSVPPVPAQQAAETPDPDDIGKWGPELEEQNLPKLSGYSDYDMDKEKVSNLVEEMYKEIKSKKPSSPAKAQPKAAAPAAQAPKPALEDILPAPPVKPAKAAPQEPMPAAKPVAPKKIDDKRSLKLILASIQRMGKSIKANDLADAQASWDDIVQLRELLSPAMKEKVMAHTIEIENELMALRADQQAAAADDAQAPEPSPYLDVPQPLTEATDHNKLIVDIFKTPGFAPQKAPAAAPSPARSPAAPAAAPAAPARYHHYIQPRSVPRPVFVSKAKKPIKPAAKAKALKARPAKAKPAKAKPVKAVLARKPKPRLTRQQLAEAAARELKALIEEARQDLRAGEIKEAREAYLRAVSLKRRAKLDDATRNKLNYDLIGLNVDLRMAGTKRIPD